MILPEQRSLLALRFSAHCGAPLLNAFEASDNFLLDNCGV
jgi:hypothetical protein